jgi:putative membrane protein
MRDEQTPAASGASALPSAPPLPVEPGWHRLHPLSPMVRAGRGLVVLVVALLFASVRRGHPDYGELIGDGVVVVVLLAVGVVSWLVTRWQVVDGVLRVETGLLRRSSQRYPLSQVQAIDIVATGIARSLGLAELRLRMAGSATRGGGRLQCVRAADAEGLRASLLAAGRATAATPSVTADHAAAPKPPLYRLHTVRLLVSVLLSRLGLVTVAAGCAVVLTVVLGPPAAAGAVGGSSALALGVLTNLYRRLNGEYGMAVTVTPDGLQLRSGLVELSTETIPVSRIQAVRMVEPPLWRPFGWCRV